MSVLFRGKSDYCECKVSIFSAAGGGGIVSFKLKSNLINVVISRRTLSDHVEVEKKTEVTLIINEKSNTILFDDETTFRSN